MEIKELINKNEIIGIVSNYENNLNINEYVKDLQVKDLSKALKMVLLDETYLNKRISDLTLNEQFKVDIMTKLNKEIIIVGNLSQVLNNKDIDYFKKLFLKLNNDYHKKIVIIDNDIKIFFNLVKRIYVIKNKKVLYATDDFFDQELYKYVKCPKIIDFIFYLGKNNQEIMRTTDIYELIKDIFRRVS